MNVVWYNPPKDMSIPVSLFPNVNFHSVMASINQNQTNSVDKQAEIIIIDAHQSITPDMYHRFPKLKKILTASSRTSHIKNPPDQIEVYRIGGEYCAQTIAEKTFKWVKYFEQNTKQPVKEIGIIGFGVIGQAINAYIRHNQTYYYDEYYGGTKDPRKRKLEEIKEFCDVIIISCPENEKTSKLFPVETLWGKNPTVINLSGETVAPIPILDNWLNRGRINAYWSDFGTNTHIGNNKVITPHTAWESEESKKNKFAETIKLLKQLTRS